LKKVGVWAIFMRTDGIYATSAISENEEQFYNLENEGYIDVVYDPILLSDGFFLISCGLYPWQKKMLPSLIKEKSYIINDRVCRVEIKRKGWPLQTVYDQPIEIKHHGT